MWRLRRLQRLQSLRRGILQSVRCVQPLRGGLWRLQSLRGGVRRLQSLRGDQLSSALRGGPAPLAPVSRLETPPSPVPPSEAAFSCSAEARPVSLSAESRPHPGNLLVH